VGDLVGRRWSYRIQGVNVDMLQMGLISLGVLVPVYLHMYFPDVTDKPSLQPNVHAHALSEDRQEQDSIIDIILLIERLLLLRKLFR
jgi:hypothetical protein